MTTTMGSLDLSTLNNLYDEIQYFWFESSAQPWGAGAHVTLYPQSEFTTSTHANYLKGQNILMNTDGLSIRNGTLPMMTLDNDSLDFNVVDTVNGTYMNVATFGTTEASIGKATEKNIRIHPTDGLGFYNGNVKQASLTFSDASAMAWTEKRATLQTESSNAKAFIETDVNIGYQTSNVILESQWDNGDDSIYGIQKMTATLTKSYLAIDYEQTNNGATTRTDVIRAYSDGDVTIGGDLRVPYGNITTDGNVIAAGSITASGLPSGLTTVRHSTSVGSISPTSDAGVKTFTVTKAGYYPIGIVGWSFAGTNLMYQSLYTIRISAASTGSATITYGFYNRSSATYSGTFYANVLWAKI